MKTLKEVIDLLKKENSNELMIPHFIEDCEITVHEYKNGFLINVNTELNEPFGPHLEQQLVNYNIDYDYNKIYVSEMDQYISIIKAYFLKIKLDFMPIKQGTPKRLQKI